MLKKNLTEASLYAYWRFRIMFFLMLGYAALYFIRHNISFALPGISESLGYSKIELGMLTSTSCVIYGFGKVISGLVGDKHSARVIFSLGLLCSAIANMFMGSTSSLVTMTIIWSLNSCFQSMGAPSCAKLLAYWFSHRTFGVHWALWSSSQQIGSAIIGICIAAFLPILGWRYAFFLPGAVGMFVAWLVFAGIRNDPTAVGLKSVEEYDGAPPVVKHAGNRRKKTNAKAADEEDGSYGLKTFADLVLRNKMVLTMSSANFFSYFVKMSILNWAPMFLCEAKGVSTLSAGIQAAIFHITGIVGSLYAGHLSDKFFSGHRARVGFIFSIGLIISMAALCFVPAGSQVLSIITMLSLGFFIAGTQVIVGIAAVDFASKKAAGTASGLTGTFGYLGTAAAGIGTAFLVKWGHGWNLVFSSMLLASCLGAMCFLLAWNTRARAFDDQKYG
ncbi:MAG: MFS transporter [Holosporales bacterium]|nr:MFS transporter [Holosporales bacterium]